MFSIFHVFFAFHAISMLFPTLKKIGVKNNNSGGMC